MMVCRLVLFNEGCDTLDELLGNLTNEFCPVLPIHTVANLLHNPCIDAILQFAKEDFKLLGNLFIGIIDSSVIFSCHTAFLVPYRISAMRNGRHTSDSNLRRTVGV